MSICLFRVYICALISFRSPQVAKFASVGNEHTTRVLSATPRYSRYSVCVISFLRHFLCICAASWIAFLATYRTECRAATVGGIISSDTHWSAANSPYIATSSVLVDGGAKLTIEPGVEVRFAKAAGLVVMNGTLAARGTVASPIKFTADQAGLGNGWSGVRFGDLATNAVFEGENFVSGSILEETIVEGVAQHPNGAVRIELSSPFIHSNEIRSNLSNGISVLNASSLQIVGNRIHQNGGLTVSGGGILLDASPGVRISNNHIYNNKAFNGGGVKILNSDNATVTDNLFESNFSRYQCAGFLAAISNGTKFLRNVLTGNTVETVGDLGGAVAFITTSNSYLQENTVQSTNAFAGVFFETVAGLTMIGDSVVNNLGHGLYFSRNVSNAVISSAALPTTIAGNTGYEIYNNQVFELSPDPLSRGNIDARNVWWKSTSMAEVQAGVFDFFDDSFKGIVFVDPQKDLADFDGDFDVDDQDLTNPTAGWIARFGVNLDGADFLRWQRDYGFGVSAINAGVPIPEPPGTLLFAAGLAVSIAGGGRDSRVVFRCDA